MTDHLPPSDAANGPEPWDAVARFLAGESTPAQAAEIRQWLAEHPDDAHVVAALDALLPTPQAFRAEPSTGAFTGPFTGPVDVEGALRRVHVQMKTPDAAPPLSRTHAPRVAAVRPAGAPRVWWRSGGMVAAAALLAVVGVTSWKSFRSPAPRVATTYDTRVGARDSITLPDSSRVILAPGSRLVVAANYGDGQREVELQGAGQFTVRHDANRPFTVRAGSAVIRDLGTTFAVKSMGGAGISVAVTEGSVALSDSSASRRTQQVELKAGDRARLLADGSISSQRGAVTADELSWVSGTLAYRDAPLSEVQADLQRWYGVVLVVRDSAWVRQSVTTNGNASEPVGKMLERMATLMGGVVTQSGDSAFIDRPGDRSRH